MGLSTCHNIFKVFVINFANHFREAIIYMPEGADLQEILDVYRRLEFLGCVGSMDCTHIRWLSCPFEFANFCIGKEGYPTLSFQVVVNHARMIRHASHGGYGTLNDINMCHIDTIVRDDKLGLLTSDGQRRN